MTISDLAKTFSAAHNCSMSNEILVRQAFADQAIWCLKLGSPFTASLVKGLGQDLDRSSKTGKTILDWPGPPDAMGDSVPLRLAGALHALVRAGELPELEKFYPPHPLPGQNNLSEAAMKAIDEADEKICNWLEYPPQTNEVARSAILYPGLMEITRQTKLPLALYELGASAGLNLILDRYAYKLGAIQAGQKGSPVLLAPLWRGGNPNATEPKIISRRGCDRNPLKVTSKEHRGRLIAYVWPDQSQRLSRIKAALKLALVNPPQLEKADAADWVEENIPLAPQPGTTRVLFHSIAFQYFPKEAKQRIKAHMARAGANATANTPLAWLAFESSPKEGPSLTLKLWPGGKTRLLARADAHCNRINWLA